MRLERIVNEGHIHNGKLYYNIGNTYFEMNDLGRAILNYRLAEQLIPNDPNLKQNLDFARSKCLDKIPVKQETKVLQTLFFWHYDLSTTTRMIILGIFFPAFWSLAAVRLFLKKTTLNWLMFASAALALIMIVSLSIDAWSRSKNISGVIIASEVTARKGDSETYQPSFNEPLHAGTEFDLRENRGRWFLIELADGRSCWVPAKSVQLLSMSS
jgi:tetratricopeptide (TPR) repeat protein